MKTQFTPKLLSFVSALILLSAPITSSRADEPAADTAAPQGEHSKWHGPCGEMDLSTSQKQAMKDEHFKFEEKRIDLEAASKHARLNFAKVASNPKSSESDIEKAAEEIAATKSKLITAEEMSHAYIVAKILKPEQREDAMKCPMMMEHHHRGPMGHGSEEHHE